MKKNITLSELAKICGCSAATVSYVLNGRKDQRISAETEQKILQMANLYQYRINPYAKALATGELHNIMFFYEYSDFTFEKSETLNFINEISKFLKENKYNVIVAPAGQVQTFNFVDAIITYKISRDTFFELANKNYVPVISIDTIINDNLFYEITNKFENIINDTKTIYLTTPYKDNEINKLLMDRGNICFINSFKDLYDAINKYKNNDFITFNYEIKKYLESLSIPIDFYCINTKEKYEAILQSINNSISRIESDNHQIKV